MEPLGFVALAAGAVMGGMTILWLVSLVLRDSGIVDIFWGMAFVLVVWLGVAFGPGDFERRWLVAVLVTIWGVRLAARIGRRNLGKPEDFRYAAWRAAAGSSWWWRSMFKVFWLQGAVAVVVALPLFASATATTPSGLTIIDGLGVLVWAVGMTFEAVGDLQLDRFKSDPANKGRLIVTGLWRFSRHPNYFGDAALWWGFGIIALMTPYGISALAGPALMSFILVRVSGVAMLERSMSKRPGWEEYAERTNAFIPWKPRAA